MIVLCGFFACLLAALLCARRDDPGAGFLLTVAGVVGFGIAALQEFLGARPRRPWTGTIPRPSCRGPAWIWAGWKAPGMAT